MSSAVVELKPKHACKLCGKPFDPEKGQELCDDCLTRRNLLWLLGVVLLLGLLFCLPSLIRWWRGPIARE